MPPKSDNSTASSDRSPTQPPALPPTEQFQLVDRPAPKPTGLFAELLDRNHLVLHYDMQDRPDLYDERAKQLVEDLSAGRTGWDRLTPEERNALDLATLEYATQPPLPSHQRRRASVVKQVTRKIDPMPEPGAGAPEEALPAFWWLR